MKSLNEIRDELAYDASHFCICKGIVCHGCETGIIKTFKVGFDYGAKAERERSQVLVDAISEHYECACIYRLDEALEQYNKEWQDGDE
jgi:hypothetical protein